MHMNQLDVIQVVERRRK